MATYGGGQSAAAAISTSKNLAGAAGTIYANPSGSYAILNLSTDGTVPNGRVAIGGQTIDVLPSGSGVTTVYVGPGQSLTQVGSGGSTLYVSGVRFDNNFA